VTEQFLEQGVHGSVRGTVFVRNWPR